MHKAKRLGISPAIEQPAQLPPPCPTSTRSTTEIQQINLHHQPAETDYKNNRRDSPATVRKTPAYFKQCLKTVMEDACLVSVGRLFHSFALRNEKNFCQYAGVFFGNLKSVAVFRRLRELQVEFLKKKLPMY